MRADMDKVLHEGARYQSDFRGKVQGARKQVGRLGPDNLPQRQGIEGRLRTGRHTLLKYVSSPQRAPLHRFLDRQVGRPWNVVHAELCEHLRLDSAPQRRVRERVDDCVLTNVLLIDGVACSGVGGRFFGTPLDECRWSIRFYVCPRSGLLRRVVPRPRRRKPSPPPPPQVGRGKLRQYHLLRGRWVEVRLERFGNREMNPPWMTFSSPVPDALSGERIDAATATARYGVVAYAVTVRLLGRSEVAGLPLPSPPFRGGRLPNLVR